jgi:hypothetical protein
MYGQKNIKISVTLQCLVFAKHIHSVLPQKSSFVSSMVKKNWGLYGFGSIHYTIKHSQYPQWPVFAT